MANKFEKKEWVDRQSQFPSRRRLTETGITNVYEIERVEGEITEIGNAFDASNMNDVEGRVYNGFDNLDDTDIKITDSDNLFTATKLNGVLTELFMYAANGKTAIANAISGISSSSTFQALATAITNGKASIANAIGDISGSSTFQALATAITNGKTAITTGLGTGNSSNTFAQIATSATTLKSLSDSREIEITNLNVTVSSQSTQIANLNGTVSSLNTEIYNGKTSIASAIGSTPGGTPTANNTFPELAAFISNYKKNVLIVDDPGNPILPIRLDAFYINNKTHTQNVTYEFGFTPTFLMLYRATGGAGDFYISESICAPLLDLPNQASARFPKCGVDSVTAHGFRFWAQCGPGYTFSMTGTGAYFALIAVG